MVPLWLALVVPSAFVVQKYIGWLGLAAYLAGTAIVLPRVRAVPRQWPVTRLWLATGAALLLLFVAAYPPANARGPQAGSDDDDAQNIGVAALVQGRSPYDERTYLGNELHQLPGALILAAPFVLMGTSAWQNLFWLAVFFIVLTRERRDGAAVLALAWTVLALSPGVIHGLVTGTAHVSNAIYVALGLLWLTRAPASRTAAVAWGVTLASRANFLLLVPLAAVWIGRQAGWRTALRATVLSTGAVVLLTAPFVVMHGSLTGFPPFQAVDRLTRFDPWIPHAGLGVLTMSLVLSCALAFVPRRRASLFMSCAVVQAVPAVAGLLLSGVISGVPDLRYAAYGAFAAWFIYLDGVGTVPDRPNLP